MIKLSNTVNKFYNLGNIRQNIKSGEFGVTSCLHSDETPLNIILNNP